MIEAPLALGFAAGMLAAFNPCGFALLPAYVAFFLGIEDGSAGRRAPVAWALAVGGAVTAGFVAVFGVAGAAATTFSLAVQRAAPWVSIPVGLALTAVGVAVAAGWKPAVRLPRLAAGGDGRGLASMALFGASYATVSLSCTLPVFLAAVATTFRDASVVSGTAVFVAYALGMGTILTGLAVAVGLARGAIVAAVRRATPVLARAGGLVLAVAGAYVTWFAVYEIRSDRDAGAAAGPVATVERWSGQVSERVYGIGPGWLAVAVVLLIGVAVLAGRRRSRKRRSPTRVG